MLCAMCLYCQSLLGNDLRLLKMLQDYLDKRIGTTAFNKLPSHQWYLPEELVALAFFDQEIPDGIKRQMMVSHSKNGDEEPFKCAKTTVLG